MSKTRHTMDRLRAYAKHLGSKTRLAIAAGVPESTIRNLEDDDWNPRAETLAKLEAAVPVNWRPRKVRPDREAA